MFAKLVPVLATCYSEMDSKGLQKILNYLGFQINKLALENTEKNEWTCSI